MNRTKIDPKANEYRKILGFMPDSLSWIVIIFKFSSG